MTHATELIRQIIRKQGLHTIYPGQEDSAFGDLLQTAWVQIERTLYKYRARPHCRACFNPDRPNDSALYTPGDVEYGIKSVSDLIIMGIDECPRCRRMLTPGPLIEAKQGTYGGTDTIIYRGVSKVFNMWCVAPNTMIPTCHGPLPASEVLEHFEAGLPVHVHGLDGLVPVEAMKIRDTTATIQIKTKCGYELECSPEHRIYSSRKSAVDGEKWGYWAEAGELEEGDLVALQYGQNEFGEYDSLSDITLSRRGDWQRPEAITEELAYLLGLYIAKGSHSYGKLEINTVDDGIITRLVSNRLGLNFVHEPQFQRVSLCNVRFIELLRLLGFPDNSSAESKTIPNRLLCLSRRLMVKLLSGMFDGDGYSAATDGHVGYTTTSATLLAQLRMILLNLGMLSKIVLDRRTTGAIVHNGVRYVSDLRGSYQLSLSVTASAVFYSEIGFGLGRKQANYHRLIPAKEYLYGLNDKFRILYRKYGTGSSKYDRLRRLLKASKCTLDTARHALNAWAGYHSDEDYIFVKHRIDQYTAERDRIVWLPITSIGAGSSNLIDLAVDSPSHSYVANGLVVHNSQVARTVILAYIKKEGRDRKNSPTYTTFLDNRTKPISDTGVRFLLEARELCQYNDSYLKVLESLEWLMHNDDKPYDGIIGKLVAHSNMTRATVTGMMKMIRLRSHEFTDSPINRELDASRSERRRVSHSEFDDE